jgi:hypothetical protein
MYIYNIIYNIVVHHTRRICSTTSGVSPLWSINHILAADFYVFIVKTDGYDRTHTRALLHAHIQVKLAEISPSPLRVTPVCVCVCVCVCITYIIIHTQKYSVFVCCDDYGCAG